MAPTCGLIVSALDPGIASVVAFKLDGEEHIILREEDVLAIIEK